MKVILISIGDELLLGQTVNTNASWLGTELGLIGAEVIKNIVIRDKKEDITTTLDYCFSNNVNAIIITGGLGPTKDDITKHTLAEYFDSELIENQEVLKHVQSIFERYNRPMLEVNKLQAMVPEAAIILNNINGTAPGMCFEKDGVSVISLPGVPYEMKGIMKDEGFDYLSARFQLKSLYFQTIHTQGIGESYLAERIADIEDLLREEGFSLAYLPSPGQVRLRISSEDTVEKRQRIEDFLKLIEDRLPAYCFSRNGESLPEVIGRVLLEKKKWLGSVESCTSGGLAKAITSVPGSSSWYKGTIVTYSNELKANKVNVDPLLLKSVGAVSKEVVELMAENGRKELGVDYCLSTSGIAGPDGGSNEKPVGTVWIGLSAQGNVSSKKFQFGTDRGRNIEISILTALNILRCNLMNIQIDEKRD